MLTATSVLLLTVCFVLFLFFLASVCCTHQGIDPIHQTRVVEILKDTEGDRRKSRDSLASVKYESGSETGEEVSMGVEWNGVSTNPLWLSQRVRWPLWKNEAVLVISQRGCTGTGRSE